jgi:ZIP family zinc transporter
MSNLTHALLLATLGGITIPLGGFVAAFEHIRPRWLEQELRHSVIAFGGGALFAAVALVLVPEGTKHVSAAVALACFAGGGIAFFAVDRLIQRRGGSGSQLMAMLLDFLPESLALGAMLAAGEPAGLLLALLICLQNFPEGFNAYREMVASGASARRVLVAFMLIVLLGPLAALGGFLFLESYRPALATIMLFAAGGILYLTFEDIAPQAKLKRHWAPSLGAVAGFLLGLGGHLALH